jgi:peptidoglycan/xylan/chitin deacetylase (PgdA/CDA1 family)
MKSLIKSINIFVLNFFNFIFTSKFKNNLRVLAYHDVKKPAVFEKQISYLLGAGYNFITINQLFEYLYQQTPLPSKPILITFDDGDVSVLDNGLPILRKYKLPSVLFVVTELIDSNKPFWWDRIIHSLKQDGADSNKINQVVKSAKNMSNQERLVFLSEFKELESRQLALKDLLFLQENNMSICNHSHTHPMFDKCTETEIESELHHTKSKFQKWDIEGFAYFAYPNGNNNDIIKNKLAEAGIKLVFLFDHALNKEKIDPLSISRIRVNADAELGEFKVKISGLHSFLMGLKQKV